MLCILFSGTYKNFKGFLWIILAMFFCLCHARIQGFFQGGPDPTARKQSGQRFFYFSTDFTVYKEGGPMVLLQRKLNITCDFSGGSRPPIAPLDPHMSVIQSCLFRAGLWSPAGKGLLYVIILSLSHMVSWVRYGI